jgi:hypothetical protein
MDKQPTNSGRIQSGKMPQNNTDLCIVFGSIEIERKAY